MPKRAKKKALKFYPWAKLAAGIGASVTIKPHTHSARVAAYAYAGRRGWSISAWITKAGNLIVERVKRR